MQNKYIVILGIRIRHLKLSKAQDWEASRFMLYRSLSYISVLQGKAFPLTAPCEPANASAFIPCHGF